MLRYGLLLFALVPAASSYADTVWLDNGDRLSGKIILFDGSKLLIQTVYAGAIPINWKQVKTLESDTGLLVEQDTYTGGKISSLKAADAGKVTLVQGQTPQTVELKNIHQIMKPVSMAHELSWKGNVDVALDYKREERDSDKYDIDYNVTVRDGMWRHGLKGEYNREVKARTPATNNWGITYALDHFLTQQWFWQGRLFYQQDKVDDPTRQIAFGTGPGYQFWEDELGALSLKTLLVKVDYRLKNNDKGQDNFAAIGTDYNLYLIGKRIELFANGEIRKQFAGDGGYLLFSETGLRYKLTDWGALNIKADHTFFNSANQESFAKTRYTAGFGVSW
ncbi:uncharacterized protein DUF481 [Pseudomonas lurida]|uniref:DUF481 domain-containing protein n=1 Tax=Pseudomonas lurida TaxID=244566 RepID=UPI000BF5025E|nr:DUF481 domain-containing protein [Pseudomonas lurida]PFG25137.1 uncharacterized protein DUF481 [Pseudomonas lurida]